MLTAGRKLLSPGVRNLLSPGVRNLLSPGVSTGDCAKQEKCQMGTSSGLKKKLLWHFILPVSQSLELGGTNIIGGGWPRAGDLPGLKLWVDLLPWNQPLCQGLRLITFRWLRKGNIYSFSVSIYPDYWFMLAVLESWQWLSELVTILDKICPKQIKTHLCFY